MQVNGAKSGIEEDCIPFENPDAEITYENKHASARARLLKRVLTVMSNKHAPT